MSGYSETTTCPKCGGESLEHSADHYNVNAICLECGYEYHTVESMLTLEELNEERKACDMEPLEKLKIPEPTCPYCGDPLAIIAQHEYQIFWEDGTWHRDVGDVEYKCNNCREELDGEITEILKQVDEL